MLRVNLMLHRDTVDTVSPTALQQVYVIQNAKIIPDVFKSLASK